MRERRISYLKQLVGTCGGTDPTEPGESLRESFKGLLTLKFNREPVAPMMLPSVEPDVGDLCGEDARPIESPKERSRISSEMEEEALECLVRANLIRFRLVVELKKEPSFRIFLGEVTW